jgi:hypothetical protein
MERLNIGRMGRLLLFGGGLRAIYAVQVYSKFNLKKYNFCSNNKALQRKTQLYSLHP